MFALQSEVMLVIFDPVTPGALRASIDCKIASSSSTQDDMVKSLRSVPSCTSSLLSHRTTSKAATLQSRTHFQSLWVLPRGMEPQRRKDMLLKLRLYRC